MFKTPATNVASSPLSPVVVKLVTVSAYSGTFKTPPTNVEAPESPVVVKLVTIPPPPPELAVSEMYCHFVIFIS